jgi:hypothetical protein
MLPSSNSLKMASTLREVTFMSRQHPPVVVEFETSQQELEALLQAEQASLQRVVSLQGGYGKSQAIAEYSNAVAAASRARLWHDLLLATSGVRRRIAEKRG